MKKKKNTNNKDNFNDEINEEKLKKIQEKLEKMSDEDINIKKTGFDEKVFREFDNKIPETKKKIPKKQVQLQSDSEELEEEENNEEEIEKIKENNEPKEKNISQSKKSKKKEKKKKEKQNNDEIKINNSDNEIESIESEPEELIEFSEEEKLNVSKKKSKKSKKNKSEKKTKSNDEEFRKVLYDQLTMIGIIVIFFIVLTVSKYYEERYSKFSRYMFNNKADFKDFYEVLELDSSVSTSEIKQQYKKLAVLWHPDKNPGCGAPCQSKFQEILEAYEVLGNEEKRHSYDEMMGVVTPIKSKTISLTETNFERLVLESNDIWVIQVYEDANPYCEQIAELWDHIALEYTHTVKFGRINLGTQRSLVRFLPINIVFLPTILSMANGYESEIYSFYSRDLYTSLKKFIGHVISDKTKHVNTDGVLELFNEVGNKEFIQQPYLLHIAKTSVLPIEYKYHAFIHHDWMDFYTSYYKDLVPLKKAIPRKLDLALFYSDLRNKERKVIEFAFSKELKKQNFQQILELAKFITIPYIYKNNFREYCYNKNSNENMELQHICIFLIKPENETKRVSLEKKIYDIIYELLPKITQNVKNQKSLFKNFYNFQFSWLDLSYHGKLRRKFNELESKNEEFVLNNVKAMALLSENKKISVLDNINNLEDWIYEILEDPDSRHYFYINDYLENEDVPHFLRKSDETIFKMVKNEVKNNYLDYKMILSCICLMAAMFFYRVKIKKISYYVIIGTGLIFYLSTIIIFSIKKIMENL